MMETDESDKEQEQQRQNQLEKKRERTRAKRTNETEEQRQKRLEQQRKRNITNKANINDQKRVTETIGIRQQNIELETTDSEESESCDNADLHYSNQNELLFSRKKSSYSSWPEPISRSLKEPCLKKFIHCLSTAELGKVTCAICNVCTSVRNSKKSISIEYSQHLLTESFR